MAFPFSDEKTFAAGDTSEWGTEVDTESKLNVRHYRDLLLHGGVREAPFRGAYCAHIDLSLGTADAYLPELTTMDIALDGTLFIGFYIWVNGLTMAVDDDLTVFALQGAADADQAVVGIRNEAGDIQLYAAETSGNATVRASSLVLNTWHHVAMDIVLDDGVSNDGSIDFYVDGRQVGTQLGSLDQIAVTHGRWGAMNIDAGTTAGHILLDHFIVDDARLFPLRQRWDQSRLMTASGLAFRGPGRISSASVLGAGATDAVLELYDTDEANTNDPSNLIIPPIRNAQAANDTVPYQVPWYEGTFQRGCYVSLAGTNPRAFIEVAESVDMTIGGLRSYAQQRPVHGAV